MRRSPNLNGWSNLWGNQSLKAAAWRHLERRLSLHKRGKWLLHWIEDRRKQTNQKPNMMIKHLHGLQCLQIRCKLLKMGQVSRHDPFVVKSHSRIPPIQIFLLNVQKTNAFCHACCILGAYFLKWQWQKISAPRHAMMHSCSFDFRERDSVLLHPCLLDSFLFLSLSLSPSFLSPAVISIDVILDDRKSWACFPAYTHILLAHRCLAAWMYAHMHTWSHACTHTRTRFTHVTHMHVDCNKIYPRAHVYTHTLTYKYTHPGMVQSETRRERSTVCHGYVCIKLRMCEHECMYFHACAKIHGIHVYLRPCILVYTLVQRMWIF
jgi:hypothetical protein